MNRPHRFSNAASEKYWERKRAQGFLPRGYIDGLTLSNDGTDATNDLVIADGVCRSTVSIVDGNASTSNRDQLDLEIPVSIIKQLDVLFAPSNYDGAGIDGGTRSGMLSSTSITDTTWHIHVVGKRGEPSEILAHNTFTQASILSEMQKIGGYTAYRNIGSIIRATSIKPFAQDGDEFLWKVAIADKSGASISTSAALIALTVPTGVKVRALFSAGADNGSGSVLFTSPDQTDSATTLSTIYSYAQNAATAAFTPHFPLRTDTSGQIRVVANGAVTYDVVTHGFIHPRGRNA